jgi:hypothetical protein
MDLQTKLLAEAVVVARTADLQVVQSLHPE